MLVSYVSLRICTCTPNSYAKTQDAYRPVSGGHLNKSIKAYPSMKKNLDQVFHDALSCSLYLAVKAEAGCLGWTIMFIAGEKQGDPTCEFDDQLSTLFAAQSWTDLTTDICISPVAYHRDVLPVLPSHRAPINISSQLL